MRRIWLASVVGLTLCLPGLASAQDDQDLLGYWKLAGNSQDSSPLGNHGQAFDINFDTPGPDGSPRGAARFDGKTSHIRIPASSALRLGRSDFSISVWINTEEKLDDAVGDLLSKYDPATRKGLNLTIKSGAGATNSQSNHRNLQFGTDDGTQPIWTDLGRPGKAVYVMALAVHDGKLYAGTCESGQNDTGHVYLYQGGENWLDCGSPDASNAVTSLISHRGQLYAGTGKYRLAGSSLQESSNPNLGGQVARFDGVGKWTNCGRLPGVEAIGGMVTFRGELYASSLYRPAGFFRYQTGREWVAAPLPKDGRRVVALGVHNGFIYAGSYDACAVYRFDGSSWESLGELESTGQTYSFETLAGKLYVGTWPNGRVFRLDEENRWTSVGRLGDEKEVMGMGVYNGKLYAGTLPLAEVYRYDGAAKWTSTGRVDLTPDVRYRRAWSTAIFQGRLLFGTLPSGHVHALQAGQSVSDDHELKPGWRHLVALRKSGELRLYVDGKRVDTRPSIDSHALDLSNDEPLEIGFGANDHFRGSISSLRLYRRALSEAEISKLYQSRGSR